VWFYTRADLGTGAYLAANSGTWSSVSDRDVKENIEAVDTQSVLERLAGVPISTWNYSGEERGIHHMGPMAQDFYTAFGLGDSQRHITTIDADGVALAAIQALFQRSQEQAARIEALEAENAGLEARLSALEKRVEVSGALQSSLSVAWPFEGARVWLLLGGLIVAATVVVQRRNPGGGR
jgi:hypothetical protein